ncbi:efflux RND transporter periplasmic adaptor subunit [Crocosphaera watsonii WH 8501]|uniref:Secretion protein HlyD n=2 Tax=Crocosphaera watsonii TaxID=263511 RepID=Q4BYW9_CROWT|nr:efflux RND transporter periplasmic adaptor subunit [Crocosphaera watsonii]EAM49107.1 Secretion protein HlyD [Crocosphaera watsonii WH 8501]CCQ49044.1 Probable RND efflux membrane fusion protein [Crocosphaera watsonii WH 8502]
MFDNHRPPSSASPSNQELKEMSLLEPLPPRRKRWPIVIGILVVLIGTGSGVTWWLSQQNNNTSLGAFAQKTPPTSVKLATITTGVVKSVSDVVGTLEADSAVILKPEITGRINRILVQEGDRISKGQLIMELDNSDWQTELLEAQAQLANAQARLAEREAGNRIEDIEEAKARLREAKARLRNAQTGSSLEEIAQAKAQVKAAEARAELAEQRVGRYEGLQEQGAISADEYQEFVTESRSAIAELEQAQRRLSQLETRRLIDIDELQAVVDREAQNLRRLETGPRQEVIAQAKADVAESLAQVRRAEVNVGKTRIVAPISGVVGDIPVDAGDFVDQGDTLTSLTANNLLELNLSVPLEDAPRLRLGLPVEIMDKQGATLARGNISFISPDVTADSQLVLAKADFQGDNRTLLNRQFTQARIIWRQQPGLLIPTTAISRLGGQTFVFVAKPNDSQEEEAAPFIAEQRQVELGEIQDNNYQVISGLKPGEKIVTAGILQVRDGAPIAEVKTP